MNTDKLRDILSMASIGAIIALPFVEINNEFKLHLALITLGWVLYNAKMLSRD